MTPQDLAWATEDLTAVFVINAQEALVASRSGAIYRTDDAGESFRHVYGDGYGDDTAPLYDISMFDHESGWAVGDGRVLATRDGGRSWRPQLLPVGSETAALRAVVALDQERGLAAGLAGVRLRTRDAGREWLDRSTAIAGELSLDADIRELLCAESPRDRCVSLGSAGALGYSIDGGDTWRGSDQASVLRLVWIEMAEGDVELTSRATSRIESIAQELGDRSYISARVESFANATEIENISRARDPELLFGILEARTLDVVGVFEGAGLGMERIQMRGVPPWGYAEWLDDDPDVLENYWRDRHAAAPGVRIALIDERVVHQGLFLSNLNGDAGTGGAEATPSLIAVGANGSGWRSSDMGQSWDAVEFDAGADLLAIASDGRQLMAVGALGRVQISDDGGSTWVPQQAIAATASGHSLLGLSFSTDRTLGLIVGSGGMVLKRNTSDGDAGWHRVSPAGRGLGKLR